MHEYTCIRKSGPYTSPPIIVHAENLNDAARILKKNYPQHGQVEEVMIRRTKSNVENIGELLCISRQKKSLKPGHPLGG